MGERRRTIENERDDLVHRAQDLRTNIREIEAQLMGLKQRRNAMLRELERVENELRQERSGTVKPIVHTKPATLPGQCPKCEKHIGRGVHIHAKHCSG